MAPSYMPLFAFFCSNTFMRRCTLLHDATCLSVLSSWNHASDGSVTLGYDATATSRRHHPIPLLNMFADSIYGHKHV